MGALTTAVPSVAARAQARGENFPVALRLLPGPLRHDLLAVYDVARTIDDTGDDPRLGPAERLERLAALDADLRAVRDGGVPASPVVAALALTVARRRLPVEPFRALVEANRLDQTTTRWATWDDLRHYCSLSADPVGRIVLDVFGAATDSRATWSDDVCTALQVLEHCQDVREDFADRDRVYLPLADLDRFGVDAGDLGAADTTPGVRDLVAFEVERAERLLAAGRPLVASLRGWARVAVAGYVAGGLATIDALRAASYDVVGQDVTPRRRDVARHLLRLVTVHR